MKAKSLSQVSAGLPSQCTAHHVVLLICEESLKQTLGELPLAFHTLAFAVAVSTNCKAGFLESIWDGSDFSLTLMYDDQLYMDAWRTLQGLKDMNGAEKLIKEGMSHKLKAEVTYGTHGYGEN